MNPILHYLIFGAQEVRDPSYHFSADFYLTSYPDIEKTEMNPLEYYINYR